MPASDYANRLPRMPFDLLELRKDSRVFISGHSLVDQPVPDYYAAVGQSLGQSIQWNRQYIVGSSIFRRTHGVDRNSDVWTGYSEGDNREGSGLDVLQELRQPKTIQGGSYNVLLITEQHGLLETMIWNDTVKYLRHFHDRFVEANPAATTYFYEPWISLDDKNDPRRWIEYERKMSPIWQCIVTRVNLALEVDGRNDRIVSLPAGLALAELIDRGSIPDIHEVAAGDRRPIVDALVRDTVHLTSLGNYYIALITFAAIHQQSPVGAWAPEGVPLQTVRALQGLAWNFVQDYYKNYRPLSLSECRKRLDDELIEFFWAYLRDTHWKAEMGSVRAQLRYLRLVFESRYRFSRNDTRNPFYFDPAAR
jgi:hypothetical protein